MTHKKKHFLRNYVEKSLTFGRVGFFFPERNVMDRENILQAGMHIFYSGYRGPRQVIHLYIYLFHYLFIFEISHTNQ